MSSRGERGLNWQDSRMKMATLVAIRQRLDLENAFVEAMERRQKAEADVEKSRRMAMEEQQQRKQQQEQQQQLQEQPRPEQTDHPRLPPQHQTSQHAGDAS